MISVQSLQERSEQLLTAIKEKEQKLSVRIEQSCNVDGDGGEGTDDSESSR